MSTDIKPPVTETTPPVEPKKEEVKATVTTPPTAPTKATSSSLQEAEKKLSTLEAYYADDKWKVAGHNPFFALKKLADLKLALKRTDLQAKAIEKILSFKQVEPTLANLEDEFNLYRDITLS